MTRMRCKGSIEDVAKHTELSREAKLDNTTHGFYRDTCCYSAAQEAQSALPSGAANSYEGSGDGEAYNAGAMSSQRS